MNKKFRLSITALLSPFLLFALIGTIFLYSQAPISYAVLFLQCIFASLCYIFSVSFFQRQKIKRSIAVKFFSLIGALTLASLTLLFFVSLFTVLADYNAPYRIPETDIIVRRIAAYFFASVILTAISSFSLFSIWMKRIVVQGEIIILDGRILRKGKEYVISPFFRQKQITLKDHYDFRADLELNFKDAKLAIVLISSFNYDFLNSTISNKEELRLDEHFNGIITMISNHVLARANEMTAGKFLEKEIAGYCDNYEHLSFNWSGKGTYVIVTGDDKMLTAIA